jgi:hypothetical protein
MRKRTSKSASGTRRTTSDSSTSGQAEETGNEPVKKVRRPGKFAKVVARTNGISADQFRQALITAGIATGGAKLNDKDQSYRKTKKR